MVEKKVTIASETGLHARPAGLLVKEAIKFKSDVFMVKNGKEFNAKSIMGIMTMSATKGDEITIRAKGEDEADAVEIIADMLSKDFE